MHYSQNCHNSKKAKKKFNKNPFECDFFGKLLWTWRKLFLTKNDSTLDRSFTRYDYFHPFSTGVSSLAHTLHIIYGYGHLCL